LKKIFVLSFTLAVLCLSLAGCSGNSTKTTDNGNGSNPVAQEPQSGGGGNADTPVLLSNKVMESIQSTQKPLLLNDCKIMYEDTKYKWPFISHSISNQTEKTISGYQLAWLAFDKDGSPLELYWDARNVDKGGDHGNVGFGNGIDYGVVVGIKEYSPKSYEWLLDTTQSISPNQAVDRGGWYLFDGWWDQSNGEHKAKYIISCIKQVTFEDGTVWENSQYSEWMETYRGKSVNLDMLQSYYPCE